MMRRPTLSIVLSITVLVFLYQFLKATDSLQDPKPLDPNVPISSVTTTTTSSIASTIIDDTNSQNNQILQNQEDLVPFMPKMTNETLKAELGNAAWKLFHTILARYPEKPTTEQRETLNNYIHYFSKVYPCGDCARHFSKLLKAFPPQTSSRQTAAVWGCHIHNKVNDRLGHPIYDCSHIIEEYDCGCGEDEQDSTTDESLLLFDVQNEHKQLGG